MVVTLANSAFGAWTWQGTHYDWNLDNTVGACLDSSTSYYKSFQCNTLTRNCLGEVSYCETLTDPRAPPPSNVYRLVAIIVPSVVVGLCLICSCCTACICYYGVQAF